MPMSPGFPAKRTIGLFLDFEIIADFSGKVAQYYNVLARAIQSIAVDACNKYGWVIPFTQLTLHTATVDEQKSWGPPWALFNI
jgi:hypothetical protein